MQQLILSIIATISLVTLVIYVFLCICRIIKKEELVEKIWRQLCPNKGYDEKRLFVFIRPIFLDISFMTYLLSGGILSKIAIFNLILVATPILAVVTSIVNNRRE